MSSKKVYAVGVGHTKFTPAGKGDKDYAELGAEAIQLALKDAKLQYDEVQEAVCGYVYGDSTSGQAACYKVGMSGIPVVNVNNNCATGSTCLYLGKKLVEAGSGCVLAVGFEQMSTGLKTMFPDRKHPADGHFAAMFAAGVPKTRFIKILPEVTENILKAYSTNAKEFMDDHGVTEQQIAKVAYKNHVHSQGSPHAMMSKEFSMEKINKSRKLFPPLKTAMAAPMASGAAAVILADIDFVKKHDLQQNAVEILSCCLTSDTKATFAPEFKTKNLCGYEISSRAASAAYTQSGLTPRDIDVFEIHDAFASNELATYEALGLTPPGTAGTLIDSGKWTISLSGVRHYKMGPSHGWVINPSGGLESKGHPTGATGVAQCVEINRQLRGIAGKQQVDKAVTGLQHNYGWASAAAVTVYKKAFLAESKL